MTCHEAAPSKWHACKSGPHHLNFCCQNMWCMWVSCLLTIKRQAPIPIPCGWEVAWELPTQQTSLKVVATTLHGCTQHDDLQQNSHLDCQFLETWLPHTNTNMFTSSFGPNTEAHQPQTQPPPHTEGAPHGQLVVETKKQKQKKTNTLDTFYPISTLSDSREIRGVGAICHQNNNCNEENRSRPLDSPHLAEN